MRVMVETKAQRLGAEWWASRFESTAKSVEDHPNPDIIHPSLAKVLIDSHRSVADQFREAIAKYDEEHADEMGDVDV